MARPLGWLTGFLAFTVAVTGTAVISASPAGAEPGNTTVTCRRDDLPPPFGSVIGCTFSDPDGLRMVRLRNTETGATQDWPMGGCDQPSPSTTFVLHDLPAAKYRVIVTDCDQPRSRAVFVVRSNGSVRQISDS